MKSSTPRLVLIAGTAALGGFLFGFDTAVINGAVGALQRQFAASALAIGLTVSAALIGSAIGAFAVGRLADRHGRVRTMALTALLFIVSSLLSGAAFTLWDLFAWRLLGGFAIGMASAVAPAYIAEIAPAAVRGRLGSLQQLAIVLGIFVALLSDYFVAAHAGSASAPGWLGFTAWRWMFWAGLVPSLVYFAGVLAIPESPRYLVARGRHEEARVVLEGLVGADARAQVEAIAATVKAEHVPALADLRGPVFGLLPIVWLGIGLSVLQQLVGINVIFYYSSVLWQSVGFSEHDALYITVITSIINVITTLIAIAAIDRFGRKPLLILGSVGMTLTLGAMALVFGRAPLDAAGHPLLAAGDGKIALVAANVYVFCFGFSWGPVVWVLLGEMFNNRIRAVALSVAAAAQWIANFVVSATFPLLQRAGLGLAYGLYAAAALVSLFIVARHVQETRGKELERM
jgi:SP family sugar:H+ symporter-like MFS transporter